jgi:hypothetical protein
LKSPFFTDDYLEPLGGLPGGSFSAALASLNCLTAPSCPALLEAYFAAACSCFSVRLSVLSLRPAAREVRKLETVH